MRTKELVAAMAWADNKITPAQRAILHAHQSDSYCQASETILAAEVRRLEADKRRLDFVIEQFNDHGRLDSLNYNDMSRSAIDSAMEASQ